MDKKRLGEVRNMKRMKICLSAAILFCFILTGCGQADENETVKSQVTQEETPVYTSSEEKASEGVEEIYPQTSEKTEEQLEKDLAEDTTTQESPSNVSEDENYYEVCTGYGKTEVEAYAKDIKNAIMNRDWDLVADEISYPIRMGDKEYTNAKDWKQAPFDELFTADFYQTLEAEGCENMFCNYQGIMLGNGQVWIGEVLDKNGENGKLKVIAVNPTN